MASRRPAGVRMWRVARQSAGSPSRSGQVTSKPRSPARLRGVGRIVAPLSARAPRGSRIARISHDGPILACTRGRVTTSRPGPQDTFRPVALRRKSLPPRPVSWLPPAPPSMSLSPSSPPSRSSPLPPVSHSKPRATSFSPGSPLDHPSPGRPPRLGCAAHRRAGRVRPAVQRVGVRRQVRGAAVHVAIGERVTAAPARSAGRSRRRRRAHRRPDCPSTRRRRDRRRHRCRR